ncbi:MAG: hypothetical protein E7467_01125 [Ruminococcaceae bacterium]|nr:hypothetical protein [Oscillospiraceae bacterium]
MQCLRCQRKSEASFCAECLKTVAQPLEDSPYLNTQIHLPTKRPIRTVEAAPQPEVEVPQSRRGLVGLLLAVTILSLILAAACAWLARQEIVELLRSFW